jgi:hypothetical protein
MGDNVVAHPYRELMAEAQREREILDTPEAWALQCAIWKAVSDYEDFLAQHDLLWDEDESVDVMPRFKATALVITSHFSGGCEIMIKDGAIDRVFSNGTNPDPYGRGPADIPHSDRADRDGDRDSTNPASRVHFLDGEHDNAGGEAPMPEWPAPADTVTTGLSSPPSSGLSAVLAAALDELLK